MDIQAIQEAAKKLVEAKQILTQNLFHPTFMKSMVENIITVHVTLDELEQLPGEANYEERDCDIYPYEAFKIINGVKFFALLDANV